MTAVKPNEQASWKDTGGLFPGRESIGPLFIIAASPVFIFVIIHVVMNVEGGCFQTFLSQYLDGEVKLGDIIPSPVDPEAMKMVAYFMIFELVLQKWMPGKDFVATVTPAGNRPVYKANGMASYVFTLVTLLILSHLGIFNPARVYDKFPELISTVNVFAILFCFMLVIKGYIAPSSSDNGSNGNWIVDYYWGVELHPRILGWDLKMFTNCRFGMMFWAVGTICFAHKNMEINDGVLQLGMFVNVALQLIYIFKFFHWEMGYMCSMDIQHDRAGFYICWGCLVWVPCVYTSHSFYLAEHCPDLPVALNLTILAAGSTLIYINYEADRQRAIFRKSGGECLIWGKVPDKIVAEYTTGQGEIKKSLLLVGGWWAVSRHFHYIPEILGALCWSLPAWNSAFVAPYFYVTFLTILLVDRSFRDDDRCANKYGPYWKEYCSRVPYKIVPGVV